MPIIYIDCSSTCKSTINTGIQRVVRNVIRHAGPIAVKHGYDLKTVVLRDGEFVEIPITQILNPRLMTDWRQRTARAAKSAVDHIRQTLASLIPSDRWKTFIHAPRYQFGVAWCLFLPVSISLFVIRKILFKTTKEDKQNEPESDQTHCHSSNILLLADSTWDFADLWPATDRFRAQGVYVAAIVYDLIPLTHPEYCLSSVVSAYTNWMRLSVYSVDFYICISRNTQTLLNEFLANMRGHINQFTQHETSFFHLGSNLDLAQKDGEPSERVKSIVANGDPVFLVVGSLEPRKNLSFVLDAFDQVWQRNKRVRLVLVGHNTWKVSHLLKRIRHHSLNNKNLFWLRDTTDTDLEYLYQKSAALVFASKVEGFGLPVVEAMQRGLPVVCGDLPVLREIADGKVCFFSLDSSKELAVAVQGMSETVEKTGTASRAVHPWLSWHDSCEKLLGSVIAQHGKSMIKNSGDLPATLLSH